MEICYEGAFSRANTVAAELDSKVLSELIVPPALVALIESSSPKFA
jgi:hypothetical protein